MLIASRPHKARAVTLWWRRAQGPASGRAIGFVKFPSAKSRAPPQAENA